MRFNTYKPKGISFTTTVPFTILLALSSAFNSACISPSYSIQKKKRANTLERNLPLLWHTGINKSLCLLTTSHGDLHIYLDGRYIKKLESGLPVDKPLWGAVDVSSRCIRVKSELLCEPLNGRKARESDNKVLNILYPLMVA